MKHIIIIWIALSLLTVGLVMVMPAVAQTTPATVEPTEGTPGTRFQFAARGFMPDEPIALWLIGPDQQEVEVYADDLGNAANDTSVSWSWTAPSHIQIGSWKMVVHGIMSQVEYVIPFRIRPLREVNQVVPMTPFSSARFDLAIQSQVGDVQERGFGGGAVVPPDRLYAWVRDTATGRTLEVIQVGADRYIQDGSGWQQLDQGVTLPIAALSHQANRLQEYASGILYLGIEPIRGQDTRHYQFWFTAAQAQKLGEHVVPQAGGLPAEAVVKIDLWIGVGDGFVHQQRTEVSTPGSLVDKTPVLPTRSEIVLTFYDFDAAGIVIEAPQAVN